MSRRPFIKKDIQQLPTSGIRKFFDLASGVKGIISLGVGEPDFVTPWHIREASVYSLEKGYTNYTSNCGLPELRREISSYLERKHGTLYDYDREILVTVGVSEAVDIALRCVLEIGDEVIIPEPCFVSYKPCTIMAGGIPKTVVTRESNQFKLKPEDLQNAITEKSKVLLLCYPNNPTGAIMNRRELLEISRIVEKHDLLVISDEIYSELTYEGEHVSFSSLLGMKERTVVVNGFSKSFAMTGWRIGYAAAPEEIIGAMLKIHQYTIMCAPVMGQMAALEALKNGEEEVRRMAEQYDQRRNLMVNGLREIGISCFEPQGAFYVFPSIKSIGMTSETFCEALLKEEKVAVVPGNAFGNCGEGYVRCSYAASLQEITEALERIQNFIIKHQKKKNVCAAQ
ncbi:aminotransferase class I/II-fold pyridoxal phosphate-dependent enzyme [Candidatus Contubernalis alkaliaceticus]|uniref:aminotransferase class I/II-fold pyridoxal phosphate-dependent enzyme n=1 Tax=Candidatus Contubernalis alkaliaceticus TaxID=338645 RepID=UPI001F4C4A1C|nr:aminotransferase class I/II-fold pyridoxal phosphate-dependent enzyme [Candidatus Contubernalis alkalaceticus]UNC91617.1 aminotransferase class I/II-fold pyridoxal phosphate-dependent enzyme [Candidatus Contubernalis alkalaceticus]